MRVRPTDHEQLAADQEIRRAAFEASKGRSDRIFGTAFDDAEWGRPGSILKRTAAGDSISFNGWNGGYPSFLILNQRGQRLQSNYAELYNPDADDERVVLIGPIVERGQSEREWTTDELRLIASFFLTRAEKGRKDAIASFESRGRTDIADFHRRRHFRISVVADTAKLIPTLFPASRQSAAPR